MGAALNARDRLRPLRLFAENDARSVCWQAISALLRLDLLLVGE
jgi:hypothetical protein